MWFVDRLQKGAYVIKKCVLVMPVIAPYNGIRNYERRTAMALSNIASWTKGGTASACGTSDKASACGTSDKASACGTSDKMSACGSACGAGDK
jgi:ACGX-repeat protein